MVKSILGSVCGSYRAGGSAGNPLAALKKRLEITYGTLNAVPKQVWRDNGYVRMDISGEPFRIMPQREYDKLIAQARKLLAEQRGYLHAEHRAHLQAIIEYEKLSFSPYEEYNGLEAMQRRAVVLREQGIPPIFLPEFEANAFALVDCIIEFVSGRDLLIAEAKRGPEPGYHSGRKLGVEVSTVADICGFRKRAFQGEKLNPLVVKEILWHFENNRFLPSPSLVQTVLEKIGALLRDFDLENVDPMYKEPKTMKRFGGVMPAEVTDRFWFLGLTAESISRVIEDYKMQDTRYNSRREENLKLRRRMAFLFPNEVSPSLAEDTTPEIIKQLHKFYPYFLNLELSQEDIGRIEQECALRGESPLDRVLFRYLIKLVRRRCSELFDRNPAALFENLEELAGNLRLGRYFFARAEGSHKNDLIDLVFIIRLELLESLSDEKLLAIFPNGMKTQKFASLANRESVKEYRFELNRRLTAAKTS